LGTKHLSIQPCESAPSVQVRAQSLDLPWFPIATMDPCLRSPVLPAAIPRPGGQGQDLRLCQRRLPRSVAHARLERRHGVDNSTKWPKGGTWQSHCSYIFGLPKLTWALLCDLLALGVVASCIPLLLTCARRRPPGAPMFDCTCGEEPSSELEDEPEPEAAPSPEPEAELESDAPASLPETCGSCSGCLAVDGSCYVESKAFCDLNAHFTWCGTPADVSVAPSPAPTRAPGHKECGSCKGCLARNGVWYPESKDYCDLHPSFTWCEDSGDSSHVIQESLAPTPAPSDETLCGSCKLCLASHGVCYPKTKDYCDLYPSFTWCGELAQVSLLRKARRAGLTLEAMP
jgi:hypothetical protein